MLKPKVIDDVGENLRALREKQKAYHDRNSRPAREIAVGDQIRLQNDNRKWIGATVKSAAAQPRSFLVQTDDGSVLRRNTSVIHATRANINSPTEIAANTQMSPVITNNNTNDVDTHSQSQKIPDTAQPTPVEIESNQPKNTSEVPTFTRYGREVKKVNKYTA